MQTTSSGIMQVQAGEGRAFWIGADHLVTCKVTSEDTEGRYSLFEALDQPQSGPPMHVHHREDEAYYILEGEYQVYREGEHPLRATIGSFVYVPKGVIHTYKNVGTTPGRMVVITTPAGLERFFEELGQPATDRSSPPVMDGPPDFAKMAAIAQKHGMEIVGPPPR